MDTSLTNLSVLIVEDDETLMESLKRMVRDFGVLSVLATHDGEVGLSLLGDEPIDIVICDYGPAPDSGLEFVRRLRNGESGADPATPIIILVSDEERSRVEAARDMGVNGFIDKPISPSSLYSRMLSVATRNSDFIRTESYCGPDRRVNARGVIGVGPGADDLDSQPGGVVDWSIVKSAMALSSAEDETPFMQSVHNDIETMIRALDEVHPERHRAAMETIGARAGIIMEQGRLSNYPLMSSLAESLYNVCGAAPDGDMLQRDAVKSHITAMAALISDSIDGDDRAMGSTILDHLRNTARQQNIHPHPVTWPRDSA